MSGVRNKIQGFTLVELLIAMLIASLLLGSMYSVYTSSYSTFRKQEQIAEAQQNARAAIQLMSRDIIMAGYSSNKIVDIRGVSFANNTSLTIQSTGTKFISYSRYSSARIGRTKTGETRQAVAERIRRLSFNYYNKSGTSLLISGNVPFGSLSSVRKINISVTAGTPIFGIYSGSCTLETTITPRNL